MSPGDADHRAPTSALRALLARVAAPASDDELVNEATTVDSMVAAAYAAASIDGRRRSVTRRWIARTAIAAGVLVIGTGTAAATGVLPDAAQSAIARATAHIGLDLPNPEADSDTATTTANHQTTTEPSKTPTTTHTTAPATSRPNAPTSPTTTSTTTTATTNTAPLATSATVSATTPTAHGPDLDGPAKKGLCTAWDAHRRSGQPDRNGTAFANLDAAATAAGQSVADFCAPVLPPPTAEPPTATSTTESTNTPKNPTGGPPSSSPPKPPVTHPVHPTHPAHPAKGDVPFPDHKWQRGPPAK